MRALHLIKTGVGAGWALNEIRVLRRLGVEIDVLLAEEGPRRADYEAAGATVFVAPSDLARLRSPGALVSARRSFRKLVRARRPDVIHSHFVGSAMFARLALRPGHPTPRVFQVPGPLHLENYATKSAELLTADRRDSWLATCALTRDIYLASGIAPGRVGLSYYGGVPRPYEPVSRADLRRELGVPPTTALLGMVAYFYAPKRWIGQSRGLKGHEDFIDAVAHLRAQGRDVAAVIVGSAWGSAQDYERQVRAYGHEKLGDRAIFTGFRADVPRLYSGIDVAVHPSHSENLGGAGESLYAGAPTVASRVGGLPDVVREGETGRLFGPGDPVDLARAVAWMLDNPEKVTAMTEVGRKWVAENLHVDTTAPQVLEFYRRMVTR